MYTRARSPGMRPALLYFPRLLPFFSLDFFDISAAAAAAPVNAVLSRELSIQVCNI